MSSVFPVLPDLSPLSGLPLLLRIFPVYPKLVHLQVAGRSPSLSCVSMASAACILSKVRSACTEQGKANEL